MSFSEYSEALQNTIQGKLHTADFVETLDKIQKSIFEKDGTKHRHVWALNDMRRLVSAIRNGPKHEDMDYDTLCRYFRAGAINYFELMSVADALEKKYKPSDDEETCKLDEDQTMQAVHVNTTLFLQGADALETAAFYMLEQARHAWITASAIAKMARDEEKEAASKVADGKRKRD